MLLEYILVGSNQISGVREEQTEEVESKLKI